LLLMIRPARPTLAEVPLADLSFRQTLEKVPLTVLSFTLLYVRVPPPGYHAPSSAAGGAGREAGRDAVAS
jgi:hypothetical protein